MKLPRPELDAPDTLAAALAARRTIRDIAAEPLDMQALSNSLFAACGRNREAGPFGGAGLTAASASNSQEIDVYVALSHGVGKT